MSDRHCRWSWVAVVVLCGLFCSTAATRAQKPEIYLGPIGEDPLPPPVRPTSESYLAKCLKNPDDPVSCSIAGSATLDGGLESAVTGQIQPSAYVACSRPEGICLELATLDLTGTGAKPPPSSQRLASVG